MLDEDSVSENQSMRRFDYHRSLNDKIPDFEDWDERFQAHIKKIAPVTNADELKEMQGTRIDKFLHEVLGAAEVSVTDTLPEDLSQALKTSEDRSNLDFSYNDKDRRELDEMARITEITRPDGSKVKLVMQVNSGQYLRYDSFLVKNGKVEYWGGRTDAAPAELIAGVVEPQ